MTISVSRDDEMLLAVASCPRIATCDPRHICMGSNGLLRVDVICLRKTIIPTPPNKAVCLL